MTDAKERVAHGHSEAVMSLAFQHVYLTTFLTSDSRLLMWQKDATCSSHSFSQHKCAGYVCVTPTAFCFIWVFVMDIQASPCPPPFKHPLESSAPFAVANSIPPGGWAKESPCISHSLQGNNQNLRSFQRRRQPWHKPPATYCMDHLPVVSQGWKPHHNHFSDS